MKKVVLIEPQSKEDHVYKTVRMPRLGLPLLGARLKAAGYRVELYLGRGMSLPWSRIVDAGLVGISTTTATSSEAYRIAGYLRSRGLTVMIGGIHAHFMPDEALGHADYVVRGEADLTIVPLLRALEEGRQPWDIPGVSFWNGQEAVHNPCSAEPVEMDQLPLPDFSLFEGQKPFRTIPVMTSRGCPFNCTFCSVTLMFGRRYRFRSTESVLRELAAYRGRSIFFCDDNFTANTVRSKELFQGMIDHDIGLKGWGAQVRAEAARDPELLELMRRSGGNMVYVGLESINPDTLAAFNKQQSVEDVRECVRRFHEYGIRVHGMFVFGGEGDTVQTIRDTVDFALHSRIDSVQFLTLTPLPGTPLFQQLEAEGRLLTRQWDLYDGHHAVFQPAKMSPEELQHETIAAFKRFYSLRNIFKNTFLTGWESSFYRSVGWWLVRHFERKSRWYNRALARLQDIDSKPVPLLFRLLKGSPERQGEEKSASLRIFLIEKKGTLHLRLQGIISSLNLRELIRTVRALLPRRCF
ncbi:MAG: radical SAM protein, partial [Dethiobacteria bacterium]